MAFGNPFTGKVTVSQAELDYFAWPCINGEKYPPTFSGAGTGSYGYQDTSPCVSVQSNAAPAVKRSAWPYLPLDPPRPGKTFDGVTFKYKFRIDGGTSAVYTWVTAATNEGFGAFTNGGLFRWGVSSGGVGLITWSGPSVDAYSFDMGVWHDVTYAIVVDGTRTLTIAPPGGTSLVYTGAGSLPSSALQFVVDSTAVGQPGTVTASIATLQIAWS